MSNQNQNPGQQHQKPSQKPGQQQGGGKNRIRIKFKGDSWTLVLPKPFAADSSRRTMVAA